MSSTTLPLPWLAVSSQFLLRPGITFLNHGSFGACPRPVFETYQAWQRELEAQPVEFLGRRLTGLLAEARMRVGDFVGTNRDNLVFVPNATYGTNIVARSIPLEAGDEVLATNHEYGAADRTWRFICEQRGVRYINQPISLPIRSADHFMEQLWQGVTERTRVIFISHITSPTAIIFPVVEVCRRAREAGITTVIDGAHTPGQIDLALDELGADYYSANAHKWLMAPKGAGFLYSRPESQGALRPLIVSWGWESERPGPSPFLDYFEWVGTKDPSAYLSVPAAIDFHLAHDWHAVRAACHEVALWARDRIGMRTGLAAICPDEWFGQMVAIPLPDGSIAKLGTDLWDEHQIEVPLIRWNEREFVRVSIQAYNSVQDVEKLAEVLGRRL